MPPDPFSSTGRFERKQLDAQQQRAEERKHGPMTPELEKLCFGLGILGAAMRRHDFINSFPKADEKLQQVAAEIRKLAAENERLKEALTFIERFYFMEGKDAKWRAAHMNSVARDAQNSEGNFAWTKRFFPRNSQALGADNAK